MRSETMGKKREIIGRERMILEIKEREGRVEVR